MNTRRTHWRSIGWLVAAWALGVATAATAQVRIGSPLAGLDGGTALDDPVTLSAEFTAATSDRPALLAITARIAPGWHVYSITQPPGGPTKTKIEPAPSPHYRLLGEFRADPAPTARVDQEAWVGLTIEEHADSVTWFAPIELADDADPATLEIHGDVRMLACKESCIPVNAKFAARLGSSRGLGIAGLELPSGERAVAGGRRPLISIAPRAAAHTGTYQADGSQVTLTGQLEPTAVRPGGVARLLITATPASNWHVYAHADRDDQPGTKPTLIALESTAGLIARRPATAAPIKTDATVPEFGVMRYHVGPVTWGVDLEVPADTPYGEYTISGIVGYQACESRDDGLGSCELPKAARFESVLRVGNDSEPASAPLTFTAATYREGATLAAASAPPSGESVPPTSSSATSAPLAAAPGLSLLAVLVASIAGGLILNLMPCVLPVIGLKILAFAEQGGESRRHILALNLAYSAGLISVFLVLATLASLAQLGLAAESYGWGELYTLLWFKVAMIVLVFAMALSFLGTWEIPLPGFAGSGTAARLATREGFSGAVCKGIFTTILATPCSGPFLGPAFGYTLTQPWWITYLIFFFVGLGMALPYLVIGAFPSLIRWLPRPGEWMVTFKQLMGFLLLGTVVYLFTTIGEQYFIPTLALLVGVWFACWWIGRTPLTASDSARRRAWFGGLASAGLVGVLAFRMLTPSEFELPWQPYSPEALVQARAEGKTVLVDFTADWCPTCQTNLKFSLNRRQVRELVDEHDVVTLVADWTDGDPAIKQALAELGSRSIPLLAVYPADVNQDVIVLPDVVTQSDVLAALRRAGPSRSVGSMATMPVSSDARDDRRLVPAR